MMFLRAVLTTMMIQSLQGQNIWDKTNRVGVSPCLHDTCRQGDIKCECYLTIEHRLTMMLGRYRVYPQNGGLYNSTNKLVANTDDIITADGTTARIVIAVNQQFPGPAITAHEGQTMIIHVRNLMHTDSCTIHWHGMVQKQSTYYDGVAFVTQCPILPGQTFTYRFTASPHGTSFYHAHIGDQRTMGLYGPLIIHKTDRDQFSEMEEFLVSIQDWNHNDDAETLYQRMLYGNIREDKRRLPTTNSTDGAQFSQFWMHSGIINGKGRFYSNPTSHNGSPLTVYEVKHNKQYRFRVIGAATLYPFRVYVEGHPVITVVASDGYDLQPMEVESFIIQPGERYDFILNTTNSIDEYLLVAESIETEASLRERNEYHVAEAVIRYKGNKINNDSPKRRQRNTCSSQSPCIIFNCPYLSYPVNTFQTCMTYNNARSVDSSSRTEDVIGTPVTLFFNFAFPGTPGNTPGSVNGRQFISPPVAPLVYPQMVTSECGDNCGPGKICECSYSQSIENGKIYQFVLTNIGSGSGWSHPIHLHGHSFYVMKAGFGTYDSTTALLIENTRDITCIDTYCNEKSWCNSSWNLGEIDDLITDNPAQKDTIIVPTGGYVIIRFKADNPGLWFFHCHIDLHNTNGMGMMINETFESYPKRPSEMSTCNQELPEASGVSSSADLTTDPSILIGCFAIMLRMLNPAHG